MIKTLGTEDTLENAGLTAEEQQLFSNARPKAYEPYPIKAVEDFANWARANSLWILAFGTGCGAIELRPLMTARLVLIVTSGPSFSSLSSRASMPVIRTAKPR